jgi:hypothetical protein
MSNVPNIFAMTGASWSDRTSEHQGDATGAGPARAQRRLWVAGAAIVAWGVVALLVGLVLVAAG